MNTAYLPIPTASRRPLTKPLQVTPGRGQLTQHEKLVVQTRKWVAMSFFEPMLEQMRNDPFRSDLMEGGSAGKTFESMFDQRLSEKMASDATDTLVQSIVAKIEGGKAYAQQVRKAQGEVDSEREGADRTRALSTGISPTGASHVSAYY
jgi:Rod binding domain-containing protein